MAPGFSLDQNLDLVEGTIHPVPIGYSITSKKDMQDGDTSFPLHLPRLDTTRRTDHSPDPSIAIGSHNQLLQRLISHTVPQDELCSLIETIFSDRKATDVIDHL